MADQAVIVGATTWGTTLTLLVAGNGTKVTLLARTDQEAQLLQAQGENSRFLPGAPFPNNVRISGSPDVALASADVVVLAVPSHTLRDNALRVRDSLPTETVVVSAAKGLDLHSAARMSEVLAEELPDLDHGGICALSGPNLAKEIVAGKPASTVIAGRTAEAAERAQTLLMSNRFRVYTSNDLVGVELGGALKNIVALGAGICDGLELGENAKSAFITRGLAEITRLGVAAGASPVTFAGLAGLGDVIATCASRFSRNRYVGEQLGLGRSWPEVRESMDNVAEGVNATEAALTLARRLDVDMPITETTYRVLHEGLSPREAAAELMERPARSEF